MSDQAIIVSLENAPIMEFPDDHPAKRYLFEFYPYMKEFCEKEIPWKGREEEAYDFKWYCESDNRHWLISTFIYHFIGSYHVQSNWIDNPPTMTEYEKRTLDKIAHAREVLATWFEAARNEPRALNIAHRTQAVLDAMERSITYRHERHGIDRVHENDV